MTHAAIAPALAPFSIHKWFESRAPLRQAFLQQQGLDARSLSSIGDDGAYRRYFRLPWQNGTAVLMETVPAGEPIATPGHALHDFVRIGIFLRDAGLHTPEIYALDEASGYALLEDFGSTSFRGALDSGVSYEKVYGLGTDVLVYLRGLDLSALRLPSYYDSLVHLNRRRVIDWYLPAVRSLRNPNGLAEEYLAVWDKIESGLPPCPQGLLHIDYHLENLMWLPARPGLQAAGILDYQWAMTGPLPYDLLNLLEDARRDVPADLKHAMKARYCSAMNPAQRDVFDAWYTVLAAQFHCRIIGQFVRLAVRDGKVRYLQHLPRLAQYIHGALDQPLLAPLRDWFAAQGIGFDTVPVIDPDALRSLIRSDAV